MVAALFLVIAILGLAASSSCNAHDNKPYSQLYHPGGRRWLLHGARSLKQAGGHGLVVPLHPKHGVTRARGLLRNGTLPIIGAVREVGYFYSVLHLGSPPRRYSVIIDTGSTITYIPCAGCKHCGKHQAEWFDPDKSPTAVKLGCKDPKCNCGTPSCQCNDNRCYYSRTYAERSSSEGWLIEDNFQFPDNKTAVRLVFGCENGETGEIYKQMADGIMGMGNNHNAFQSQLVANGIIEDVFSLCFGYPQGGTMLLGDIPPPAGSTTVFTPLLTNLHMHYYNVRMDAITVAGQALALDRSVFDRGYGVVLDSGTTFSYVPTAAFTAFSAAVGKYAESKGLQRTSGADPQYNDICWKGAPDSFDKLESVFPVAEMVFGSDARLRLTPLRYLFMMKPGEYCLGFFDNGNAGTLVGGVSVRNVLVQYDRRQQRVGFTETACDIWSGTDAAYASDPDMAQNPYAPSSASSQRLPSSSSYAALSAILSVLFVVAAIALAADAFFLRKARYVEWACGVHEAVGMRLAGGKGLAASSTELAPLKAPVSANDG